MTRIRLDRTGPMPLWAQVHAHLRERLEAGEFAGGFPTDHQLVQAYGVSRQTVREAVRRLADAGLLERERGRGTRVRPFEYLGGGLESLHEQIEAQGAEQRSVVLEAGRVTDAAVAARLGLDAGATLVHIARLRLADGEPVALDDAWLDEALGAPLLDADLTHSGIYPLLRETTGVDVDGGTERLTPIVPTPAQRAALGLPRGTAAFSVERLTRHGERPVEWRRTLVRGDRWTITLELSRAPARPQGGLPWTPVAPG
ncbi:GntR family transcriptional regulator [Baekduia soli]|uniref:GntR family transcriptional regulator n=1 Tax=Baekduia soli TaxID=496014 RepID=A0A5B8U8E3_9ACTN|nr:GntR family transcriptional regulator [Baekduia soli]QEC49201.1 GntR family transcriptional regulator [Baekduia soli]